MALASVLYLLLAVVMGLVERLLQPAALAADGRLRAGDARRGLARHRSSRRCCVLGPTSWGLLILAYCFVASLMPVWALLQPRGYLGGFVLYLALVVGVVGIFFGGFADRAAGVQGLAGRRARPASLFPFLFVTIACGACSGFHGLVCSGTTSKQIAQGVALPADRLRRHAARGLRRGDRAGHDHDGRPPTRSQGKAPGALYGGGLGRFLAVLIGEQHLAFAVTFGAMAFSTFVFDTLDVSTRLGRYILQELFGWRGRRGAVARDRGHRAAAGAAGRRPRGEDAYRVFWTLFGTSNQLLAALTLLAVSVWLHRSGRRYWFTLAADAVRDDHHALGAGAAGCGRGGRACSTVPCRRRRTCSTGSSPWRCSRSPVC